MLGVFGWIYHARSGITHKLKLSDSRKEGARFLVSQNLKYVLKSAFVNDYYKRGFVHYISIIIQVSLFKSWS